MIDSVVICIPTYRRPKLLHRLLDAIAAQQTNAVLSVLVADNDAERRAGLNLCLSMEDYPWPLTAVVAPNRGQVRNVLIEYALLTGAPFIAMIDDDQCPPKDWIDQFLKTAHATGADLLQGPLGQGMKAGDGDPPRTIEMPQGAANLLMRRTMLEGMAAPWFDPQFVQGGDQNFFVRLRRAARRFARCDEPSLMAPAFQGRGISY